MGLVTLMRPAKSLAVATDVLAGYCVASEAMPRGAEAMAQVPLLFAGAAMLGAAGGVFDACFAAAQEAESSPARGPAPDGSLKGAFLAGAALALGGVFAVMAGGVSAGRFPVYFAAFMFLLSWARAGRGPDAVLGPVASGLARAFAMGLGMSARPEVVYLTRAEPIIAAALAFASGALAECIEQAEHEGSRRWLLVVAAAGLLAVSGAAGATLMRRPLAWIVAASGGALVLARAVPAVRTLLPIAVRRFGEAAAVGTCFLNSAICFGRWPAEGAVLAMGAGALAMVLACAALFERYAPAGLRGPAGEAA